MYYNFGHIQNECDMKSVRANRIKLEIAMEKACMDTKDLQESIGMSRPTVNCVISGRNVRPGTIGKIARTLGVDVVEILEEENRDKRFKNSNTYHP